MATERRKTPKKEKSIPRTRGSELKPEKEREREGEGGGRENYFLQLHNSNLAMNIHGYSDIEQ